MKNRNDSISNALVHNKIKIVVNLIALKIVK